MTLRTLVRRSLRFHARSHLGVIIGAAVASAALIGALVVGDSVRESLRQRALARLGWVHYALAPQDRFFSEDLVNVLEKQLSFTTTPPARAPSHSVALQVPGAASRVDGTARANSITVFGVDKDFWGSARSSNFDIPPSGLLLNESLARQLRVRVSDEVLLRCPKPSALSREVAVTPHNEETIALRFKLSAIMPDTTMAGFALNTGAGPPLNAFIRLDELRQQLAIKRSANLLICGSVEVHEDRGTQIAIAMSKRRGLNRWFYERWMELRSHLREETVDRPVAAPTSDALEFLNGRLKQLESLDLIGLRLRNLPDQNTCELRSANIFLESEVVRAVEQSALATNSQPVLTLLVNLLQAGTNQTPYSMVTAAGPPYTPADLRDDEILFSQWLADDLRASPGDPISVVYFDPESGARLVEKTNTFRVRSVVTQQLPWDDRTLMPDFPGIETAESTSDWDAGFPLVYKIRPKDEDYWKKYKGTPKAFITLAAGRKMWGNRFGTLTAYRFPVPPGTPPRRFTAELEKSILEHFNPAALGLRFEPVREQALKGAEEAQDFGQLFLGFSIFLVVSALLLMALLFQFGLEQRTSEIGILLALGFRPKRVRRMFLLEGGALAFLGTILGTLAGLGYAKAMLWGLTTVWSSAIGSSALGFHVAPETIVIGICASVAVAIFTIWLTLRKQGKQPVRELLEAEPQNPKSEIRNRPQNRKLRIPIGFMAGGAAIVSGLGIAAFAWGKSENAESFFSAGSLLLVGGLLVVFGWLGILARSAASSTLKTTSLAVRAGARRKKRSVATVALLASGCFLIVSIGVFRLDANQDALKRSSGTGGFALIGESTLPIVQDLNTRAGREAFGLSDQDLEGVTIVPFRVHEGDEASCLNLNRAQRPRVIGVRPELLTGRFTFSADADKKSSDGWRSIQCSVSGVQSGAGNEVPAIGDANSIQWALHQNVGDTIDYSDESERTFKLHLVGAIANSMLQGNLIIDEADFVKLFPRESGYKMFLIDAPTNKVAQVSEKLSRALQDVGLQIIPAVERLNAFNAVQNTYLGTFQMLGGLGLLLGSAGLAIVVLRNMLERRGELALLVAVGFTRRSLEKLTLLEHGALLVLGLGLGILSALVAVLPALLTPGKSLPHLSLSVTLAAVFINGLFWTWAATRLALRGDLLQALRNE
jgi:ABC-type antimicrobial peptide transport system permease subunit